MKALLFIILSLSYSNAIFSQINFHDEAEKCGIEPIRLKAGQETLGDRWGYSYDVLLADISVWEQNKYIEVFSIGRTEQSREIYELTVTDPVVVDENKRRIYLHARTHPNEVQSFWVMREMIRMTTEDSEYGKYLRRNFIFHFVPMYNPDGVESEFARENGNNIDIESNWNASAPEAETQALHSRFEKLMRSNVPIEMAINMHSAYACKRYFVYHHNIGTSTKYANMEQFFIAAVQSYFPSGIEPYSYFVSWSNGTPTQYPESWWWLNYREQVMALTYEDMNCAEAGMYDQSANAIIKGMVDYFENRTTTADAEIYGSISMYPNPVAEQLNVSWEESGIPQKITITDLQGNTFSQSDTFTGNTFEIDMQTASSGMYIVVIEFNNKTVHTVVVKI